MDSHQHQKRCSTVHSASVRLRRYAYSTQRCVNVPWRGGDSVKGLQTGSTPKRGGITNGDADSAYACTLKLYWSAERGKGKERGGREREGTRGDSLHEWIKERDWSGVMLQKVIIILEVLPQKKVPARTERANCVFLVVYLLRPHVLDQRRISCCSTIQSFEMEGRGRIKQL